MSMDFRGDPSAALLEVLDPEQNHTFLDHYLDVEFDLSRVMFICTANQLQGIPVPLQDRFEILHLAGDTEEEKMSIAHRYLIPKEKEANGVQEVDIKWNRKATRTIIQRYTREAGVRSLQREIATCCRKMAKTVVKKGKESSHFNVTPKRVQKWLGVPKFRHGQKEQLDAVGVVTGLAWTQVGGDLLQIEVSLMPGKGKLMITGKLGDVMQESAQAAMSYVRSRCKAWGLPDDFYTKVDLHVHVPEGATPKDGPSAGITMATALVSALTNIPVHKDIAMTGEITLRGRVLPIGGLKEKSLAAHRAGITTLIVPKDNEKDLVDIPVSIRKHLKIHLVEHMDEVLPHALVLDNPEEFKKKATSAPPMRLDDIKDEKVEKKNPPVPGTTTSQ
jgi:ATP-dependent Lon protease